MVSRSLEKHNLMHIPVPNFQEFHHHHLDLENNGQTLLSKVAQQIHSAVAQVTFLSQWEVSEMLW